MKRIVTNTLYQTYNQDTIIKPVHSLWMIRNDGSPLLINNSFILDGGGRTFGVDALKLMALIVQVAINNPGKEKIQFVNETQFSVALIPSNLTTVKANFTLIETSVELI